MSQSLESFELENCEVIHETDAAILVELEDRSTHWVPLSQVEKIERHKERYQSKVRMPVWLAKKKGFI